MVFEENTDPPLRGRSTCRITKLSSSPTTMGFHRPKSPIPKIKSIIRSTITAGAKPLSPSCTARKKPAHLQGGKLTKLPKHVIHSLAGYLCTWDLLHLSLTCKHLRQTLLSILYHTLDLRTNRSILRLLPVLPHRPEIHPHIKHLIVRPNNVLYTAPGEEMLERRVEGWVTDLLGSCSMEGLEGFVWDGREMAGEELWLVLRTECPLITHLGTSIGTNPLNSRSHFYEFSNLRSLSLSVKCPEYGWTTGPQPTPEKLPRRFWAMLIERCPGLTSLSFTGHAPCPRIFDARHIVHGRWEQLRHLGVGEMVCFLEGSAPASETGHDKRSLSRGSVNSTSQRDAFASFLALHPGITTLTLAQPTLPPSLPRLPLLTSLTAPPALLRSLSPGAKRTIHHLRISTLHHAPSALGTSCAILGEYTGLRSLSFWVDFSFAGGYGPGGVRGVVETILRSVTDRLECIELWLFTRSGCSLDDVLLALRAAAPPGLRTVRLMMLFDGKEVDVQRVWSALPGVREFEVCKSAEQWLSACGGWVRNGGRWEVVGEPVEGEGVVRVAGYEWKDANKARSRVFTREVEVDGGARRACAGQARAGLSRTPGSTSSSSTGSSQSTAQSLSSFEGKSVSTTYSASSHSKPLPHTPSTSVFSSAPSTVSFSSFPPRKESLDSLPRRDGSYSHSTPSSPMFSSFTPASPPLVFLSDSGKIPSPPSDKTTMRRASLSTIGFHPPPSAYAPTPSSTPNRRSLVAMQPPSSWRSASPTKSSSSPMHSPTGSRRPSSAGSGENRPPSTWLSRRLSFTGSERQSERRMSVGSTPRATTVHFDDPPMSRPASLDGHGSRSVSMHGDSADGHVGSSRPASICDSYRGKRSLRSWVGSVVGRR